ncbi:hypothetical protein QYE76_050952 [Lolium multiflorum]|uniref:Transposase-associated domain-containing protein n=1 Tax=Lolium multiflorum TaxID=4521 RepID=A0AAD8SSU2_LOLMU|nr:hypothetical protein QYE76_050952 [Lolium multiflorum]
MRAYCRRTCRKDAPGKKLGMAAVDSGQAQESLPAHQPRGAPAENALLPAHPWAGAPAMTLGPGLGVAIMVIEMSESIVMRYLKHAIIDMYENNRTEVLCPCRRCKRGKWFDPYSGKLQGHLLTNGFMHGHTQWMSDDGAEVNGATASGGNNGRQEGGHHDIDDDEEFVAQDDNLDDDNNLDGDEEVPLASVVRDPHLQDLLLEKTKGGAKRKSKLEQLEIDSNTPLSVDDLLEYVKDLLPAGNTCPGSLAEAKRITCPLDLPHEKYHACINDCIMYRKEHMDKTKCPVCEAERYKKGKKKAPRKVVWYFPLAPGFNGVRVPFGYSGLISRYMDPKKRNFSGMKSHDCHVMMTQILPVAIRGIMDDHVRATLTGLCNFFDVITRKSISVKKLARLQEEIVVILCELEMSHPDGSIVQGWLTEECISFCTNYLDIEDPVGLPQNKHLRRFEGVGHKNGRKELHVHMSGRTSDFDRANLVALQHIDLIDPWLKEHKTMIENSGKPMMTEAEIYREHNSSFARWFKDHIDANPPPMDSDKDKLVLALSHGPAPNIMTYQAYDINGYTFYTEEKDKNSVYQNSGVTMDSWTGDVKTRYYGRIEEIWELSYAGEKVPMFRIRWAKSVTKEDRYFTTMFLPEANKSKSTNATAQNEPWVLAEHVHQCFFITDPSRPSRVIVRRGKRTIVGMDGVANEEDFEGQVGDPMMEESEDEDTTYTTRRSRTTLPRSGRPFKRRSHDTGLNYSTTSKKSKKKVKHSSQSRM